MIKLQTSMSAMVKLQTSMSAMVDLRWQHQFITLFFLLIMPCSCNSQKACLTASIIRSSIVNIDRDQSKLRPIRRNCDSISSDRLQNKIFLILFLVVCSMIKTIHSMIEFKTPLPYLNYYLRTGLWSIVTI